MIRTIQSYAGRQLRRVGGFLESRAAGETFAQTVMRHYHSRQSAGKSLVPELVDEELALKLADCYACVKVMSETKGSLPVDVLQKKAGKWVNVESHPVKHLLAFEPHPDMIPMAFQEARQAHVALWGNSYTGIDWDLVSQEVTRLTPMHPSTITPLKGKDDLLYYRASNQVKPHYGSHEMLHVPGFTTNGLVGVSPIRCYMGDLIRLGKVEERFVKKFFDSGARPSIAITVPEEMGDIAYNRLKGDIEDQVNGENAWKVLLLEGGSDLKNFTMPLGEAQLLESRVFNGKKIATCVFNCPPMMVGHMDDANNNSLDAMIRYFARHTMRPWLIRDEQEMARKLFRGRQRGKFIVRYNIDGLERGDITSRYQAHRNAIFSGFMTLNEVRALEDLPPLPGGDDLAKPAAIFGKQVAPSDAPKTSNDPPNDKKPPSDDENVRGAHKGFIGLTGKVISGLVQRQVRALERAAKSSLSRAAFEDRVAEIFDQQAGIVQEKLGDITTGERLRTWIEGQRRDCLAALPTDPAGDLAGCVAGLSQRWDGEVIGMAVELVNSRVAPEGQI